MPQRFSHFPIRHSNWIRHLSFVIRHSFLILLALLSLTTLIHKSDQQTWDINRSVMVAPDEFSYLLTAQSLLEGHGISTQKSIGLDTFYPPGYPLLLAGWSLIVQHGNITPFAAHAFNAILLSAATIIVYLFARRLLLLLETSEPPRHRWGGTNTNSWLALLIAGIFATNWHVLEGALFILSEPAFMLATFAWLALTLRWPDWHLDPLKAAAVALLAITSWSIRGAGIVCIVVTLTVPFAALLYHFLVRTGPFNPLRRLSVLAIIFFLAAAYQLSLVHYSPEKSLFSPAASANSYPTQLLRGITADGYFKFSRLKDWPDLLDRNTQLAVSHLDDFARSFTPWLRDPPDMLPRYLIGKVFALLAVIGLLHHLVRRRYATPALNLFLIFYFILYLLWPFNMSRFWAPILPIMLVLIADALRHFFISSYSLRHAFVRPVAYALLMALLLALNASELITHLGNYQRRLNYVSDALAGSAATVVHRSADTKNTIVAVAGDDEHFIFAWYLPQIPGGEHCSLRSPQPHLLTPDGNREHLDQFLIRTIEDCQKHPTEQLFIVSYFTDPDYPQLFQQLRQIAPERLNNLRLHRVFQREWVTSVWLVLPDNSTLPSSPDRFPSTSEQ